MAQNNLFSEMDGYSEIVKEIEVLQKYGPDYSAQRGRVGRILERLHPPRLNLRLSEIRDETVSTKTLRFTSAEGFLPPFQAGQYINLFVETGGVRTSRPYSISSPPNQVAYYDLTVRRTPDGFVSNYLLDEARVGEVFVATSPAGNFYFNPLFMDRELMLLAGGSGITPLMSMIREATDRGLDRKLHLIYGCRLEGDVIFEAELRDRAARHPNFKFDPVVSEPSSGYAGLTGFLAGELIKKIVPNPAKKTFFLCGPEAMYDFCLPELEKLGAPRRKIRTEVFGGPKNPAAQPGWPEEVSPDAVFEVKVGGRSIPARAGEPLLVSLERAGLAVPAQCRAGECSLCRVKLLSGRVFQPRGAKVRRSDRTYGYIHSCAAYPLADLEILI
ncbi:MAG: 2Fe-2S iron-sulfur cluster-binding protein [Pseudomonadota bacterium]